jgi:hypothetical protein
MDVIILFLQQLLGLIPSEARSSRPRLVRQLAPAYAARGCVGQYIEISEFDRTTSFRGRAWLRPAPVPLRLARQTFRDPPDS